MRGRRSVVPAVIRVNVSITPSSRAGQESDHPGKPFTALTMGSGMTAPSIAAAMKVEAASEMSTAVALVTSAATRYVGTSLDGTAKPVISDRYRLE